MVEEGVCSVMGADVKQVRGVELQLIQLLQEHNFMSGNPDWLTNDDHS